MNIGEILAVRQRAAARGDWSLVAEADSQLARLGYRAPDDLAAGFSEVAVTDDLEHVVPVKRGPGRPRKVPQ